MFEKREFFCLESLAPAGLFAFEPNYSISKK